MCCWFVAVWSLSDESVLVTEWSTVSRMSEMKSL